jgi:hypothetical protein
MRRRLGTGRTEMVRIRNNRGINPRTIGTIVLTMVEGSGFPEDRVKSA